MKQSLTKYERETIISWSADEDKIFICSSQQPMIRRLLKNPLFELKEKQFNKNYSCHPNLLSIEGFAPLKALTIRTKLIKRSMTDDEKKEFAIRMKNARED